MLQNQCISVTDLRTNTKECLKDLNKEPKYIFMNNHPIAVLLDINEYEERLLKPQLIELQKKDVDPALEKQATTARKSKKADLININ